MIIEGEIPYNQYQEDREFSIETPLATVKSDSGNHVVDVLSVLGVVLILIMGKRIVMKVINKI